MDKHLVHIIKQTESYTEVLRVQMHGAALSPSSPHKVLSPVRRVNFKVEASTVLSSSTTIERNLPTDIEYGITDRDDMDDDDDDDGEYVGEDEIDDETTLIEEELRGGDMDHDQEIALLKSEAEMSVDELRAMYANLPDDASESDGSDGDESSHVDLEASSSSNRLEAASTRVDDDDDSGDDDDDDGEYVGEDEIDDETTLIEEELRGGDMYHDQEIALLKSEAEMSVDELRAMYTKQSSYYSDDEDFTDSNIYDSSEDEISQASDTMSISSNRQDVSSNLKIVVPVSPKASSGSKSVDIDEALRRLDEADSLARSINIEKSFLLSNKLSLREYQQTGLNWLVSLHERRLNGILADEMGLGKTIQTIAMLAHLATYKGIWGPHLIIVPTSCIMNWEAEFKRWCPIFKILTYYGSAKTRKNLRSGWTKLNSFHVCVTSYQLVVQDSNSFKRKRWYYMILDEAHNIKNFKSQRWQTLLNFNTQRRLLLTGTPLQNSLMELWSLLHFLMPHIFRSRKEFSYWFSNPLSSMVEGNRGINSDLIGRLHSIIRPFLLRRLKKDVAKQLPAKYEHIVFCKLSKRQLHLYEEFMSRSSTRVMLTGGFMGMMNVLMQLRKVCNHPDLFEPRPIVSPFICENIEYNPGNITINALSNGPLSSLSKSITNLWAMDDDVFIKSGFDHFSLFFSFLSHF